MSFLLDTNVVSKWVKARPNPGIAAWLADVDDDCVYISVVTLAELRHGIERMLAGRRRKRLDDWLREELPSRFEDRVLPIDNAVADAWGRILARSETAGRPAGLVEAFIAATAEAHGLTLVTRNASHFESLLKDVLNPWTSTDPEM